MMQFTLGSIDFNTGTPDQNGALWFLDKVEGWDSPPQRIQTVEPSSRHGSISTQNLLGARALVLGGVCKTSGGVNGYWAAYNNLLGATAALGVPITLTGYEDVAKSLQVTRAQEVRIEMGVGSFRFEVPMSAADPVKYGDTQTIITVNPGSTVALVNTGTFDSAKMTGTMKGTGTLRLTHQETGRYVSLDTLPTDAVLDFNDRTVEDSGGVNLYGQMSASSQWWTVPPGTSHVVNSGTAGVTLTYYSAWA